MLPRSPDPSRGSTTFSKMAAPQYGWDKVSKNNIDDIPTLSEALEQTGYGCYSYLVIIGAGINIMASVFGTLTLSLVVPATDCDLNLSTGEKGLLSTMMFTGMLFTSHLFGALADEYGRKYIAMRCSLACSFFSFISAFCPDFISLVVVTFLNGASTAGIIIPSYVFVGESIRLTNRPVSILLAGSIGNLSTAILPALSILIIPLSIHWDVFGYYTFSSWRVILLLSSLPSLTGVLAYMLVDESPKYLLSKGYKQEALDVIKHIYSVNTGRPQDEFPIQKSIRLDPGEMDTSMDTDHGTIKRIWIQTVTLFQKPLLKFTIQSCLIQAGLVGVCNIFFLWLPQLVKQMMNYAADHPMYGVTLCEVAEMKIPFGASLNSSDQSEDLQYDLEGYPCALDVPVDTYYVSFAMGVSQFIVFMISGGLSRIVGSKVLLVLYTFLCAGLCFGMTLATNMWTTIVCMAGSGVVLAACLPISIGILIEFFPTTVRSTATCICMVCGRLASTVGAQIIGLMQENYCDISYWGLSTLLIGIGVLTLLTSTKRKG